jgi:hypothetical protein
MLSALAIALIVAVAGCGGDDDDDDAAADTTAAETTVADTSATSAASSSTTATTVKKTEDTSDAGADVPPWRRTLAQVDFAGEERASVDCPPEGEAFPIWGTEIYTDDSSICTAAVHAGLITFEDGGDVVIQAAPGQDSYTSTEANGVTSSQYGPWRGSFVFPDDQPSD